MGVCEGEGQGGREERTIFTVPSQELDIKVSLEVWFQNTEKVSLLCS